VVFIQIVIVKTIILCTLHVCHWPTGHFGTWEGDALPPSQIPSRSKPTQDIVTYLVKTRKTPRELKFCT